MRLMLIHIFHCAADVVPEEWIQKMKNLAFPYQKDKRYHEEYQGFDDKYSSQETSKTKASTHPNEKKQLQSLQISSLQKFAKIRIYLTPYLCNELLLWLSRLLEGKRYQNNFQEHHFLRDLKIRPFLPCYIAAEKEREFQIP